MRTKKKKKKFVSFEIFILLFFWDGGLCSLNSRVHISCSIVKSKSSSLEWDCDLQEIDKIGEVEKGPIQVTTKHSINVNFDKDNHEYHAVVVVGEKDILLSYFNPIFVNDFTFE